MTNKIISSGMFVACVAFLAFAQTNPGSMLFIFASPNLIVNILRLVLATAMVIVSFERVIISKQIRNTVKYLGFSLTGLGIYSMITLGYGLYDYVKVLDALVLAETGVMFTFFALTTSIELQSTDAKLATKR